MTPNPGASPRPLSDLVTGPKFRFLEANCDYGRARWVFLGAPLDETASSRPGCGEGPVAVRTHSDILEDYSPLYDRRLRDAGVCDVGDVVMSPGALQANLDFLRRVAGQVFREGKRLVTIGGEHLLTLAVVQAALPEHPNLAVVQFDAHADMRDDYLGRRLSHATVARRIREETGPERLHLVGTRSVAGEDYQDYPAVRKHPSTLPLPAALDEAVSGTAREIQGCPFYLSIDIDVVDPAFAPGTGSPEPGGPSSLDVLNAVNLLLGSCRNLVGADVVEVCPSLDPSGITSLLAARIVRDLVLALED